VQRGVVLTARPDFGDERVFAREDSPEVASSPSSVAMAVTLMAGLRSGLVTSASRHTCNGYNCSRTHGELGPADALGVSCHHFFESLATRLGSAALGASFASLGLEPPPIPEDGAARARLVTRGEGWTLSPRRALRLARTFVQRPAPWFDTFDEALVPRVGEPGPLRGVVGSDELSGWFVGYATGGDPRLVVVRVAGCPGSCGDEAVRVARWAVDRLRALPDAGSAPRRRRR
jgi:hypothetical protein